MSPGAALRHESSRTVSIRYFNLYRIVLASAFAIFGGFSNLGDAAPELFRALVALYWLLAVAFAALPGNRQTSNRMLALQVSVDIFVLTAFMFLSGGARSGIPYLMMVTIAGACLVSEGRMVLGFAALATLAVLFEQSMRMLAGFSLMEDFTRSGMSCAGFFAVALLSRLLARRALANEELARRRGADLARQVRVNARIIEDMLDGVVVIDEAGQVRQFNPGAVELLGAALREARPLVACSPTLAQLADSHPAGSGQLTVFVSEAAGRTLRLRVAEAGTDRVLYLEDLDRVQAQAQQIKLAALGRLTANIAHEIRNPLSSITHASDLLAEEKRGDVQLRLLRIVRENAARIERMVKDVLELGRRDRATTEALEMSGFLRAFMDDFCLPMPTARQMVRVRCEAGQRVLFDRVHLHQVLTNLVTNALRYCSKQDGAVRVEVRAEEGKVLIAVSDDGPGIHPSERNKVFEPFFTSDPKGTGLGLYIARELSEANEARLTLADSEHGAHFHLSARSAT
ncbi:MAG: HAMP domain-containing sensor histidine kinase [Rhodocyclaceae bacterium]